VISAFSGQYQMGQLGLSRELPLAFLLRREYSISIRAFLRFTPMRTDMTTAEDPRFSTVRLMPEAAVILIA
jgi:hypothetical protein